MDLCEREKDGSQTPKIFRGARKNHGGPWETRGRWRIGLLAGSHLESLDRGRGPRLMLRGIGQKTSGGRRHRESEKGKICLFSGGTERTELTSFVSQLRT